MNCPGAGLERMRCAFDRLGIAACHCAFESREASGGIFDEGRDQWPKHLLDTRFAQLRAKPLDINAR
jgi:hypothetical protein